MIDALLLIDCRFLPKFKKTSSKKATKQKESKKKGKKSSDVMPPAPTPRKEDLEMESGEYFINEQTRKENKLKKKKVCSFWGSFITNLWLSMGCTVTRRRNLKSKRKSSHRTD
jgi:hypothetical protein